MVLQRKKSCSIINVWWVWCVSLPMSHLFWSCFVWRGHTQSEFLHPIMVSLITILVKNSQQKSPPFPFHGSHIFPPFSWFFLTICCGICVTDWWFGTWILFFHILGMSSSQLTNSIIFQRGRYTTNQLLIYFQDIQLFKPKRNLPNWALEDKFTAVVYSAFFSIWWG